MTEGALTNGNKSEGELPETNHNPLEQLRRNIAATVIDAVDELHVAALLESRGVTDSVAQQKYGYHDVFTLAEMVYSRRPIVGNEAKADVSPGTRRWRKDLQVLAHGPLYMLSSTVYPAIIIVLGSSAVFRVLVFATAFGWIWGMGVSTAAYQLLGRGMERSAGRAFRLLSLIGIAIALCCGILFAATGPGGAGLVLFIVAQVTFQLMSGILIFHGKELWLALTMLPAFLIGLILMVSGFAEKFVLPTLVTAGVCVVLLAAIALLTRAQVSAQSDSQRQVDFVRTFAGISPSVCYAALCALYFLNTEARSFNGGGELAIAGLPLVLGMGVLEWRANRFSEKVRELFSRLASPSEFQGVAWRLLLTELINCLTALGGLCAIFIFVMFRINQLTGQLSQLADAYALLGGVFFLGFIMANHRQFARLLGIMLPIVLAEFLLVTYTSQDQIDIFLICTSILLASQVVMLRESFRCVQRYY